VLPAILVIAWLLPGLPLLLAREFLPVPMLLISAPLAVALVAVGLRRVPAAWPRAVPGPGVPGWAAWCGAAGTVAVAAGFAVWQFRFSSGSVIVLRDPGAFLQAGYWIAEHGSLPIPESRAAFGGAPAGLAFSSTGFFTSGGAVVPGFMSGLPLLLAAGFWVHGIPAGAAMAPVLGGLAVLAFGGLVGRLAGPQWAPAGALALALTLPELYTTRAPFTQPVSQVLLLGGLCLVIDALTLRGPQRVLVALGGLALGLTVLVGIDGLVDLLPAIPFAGILAMRRSGMVVAFCSGLVLGTGYGVADGYLLARPFLASLGALTWLIAVIALALAAVTVAAVALLRSAPVRRGLRKLLARRPLRWLPGLAGVLVGAALVGLAFRPYVQTVRGPATGAVAAYVASLQRLEQLPVAPGRLYAEDTLYWVIWYVGVPAVLLGGFGVALLARSTLSALLSGEPRAAARSWGLPLALICWGAATVLWQPETVPDQPWASRRLVPLVIPGLIAAAIWAAAWLAGQARDRGASSAMASVVGCCCVAALLVPTASTTFGLALTHSGTAGGLRPLAGGLGTRRIGQGEAAAVRGLCAALGPSASVVILDRSVAGQFTQVIRGMCGVPAGSMAGQSRTAVASVISAIEARGRRPVLLAARPSQLAGFGGIPIRVLDLSTTQDPHELTQPPTAPWPVHYVIWMQSPRATGAGA
jgi:hypothetical protein